MFLSCLKKNPSPTDKVTYRVACAITINTNSNDYQETYAFSLCGKVQVKWICFRSWRTFSRLGNFGGICMRYLIRFLQWWYHSLKSCNTTTSPFTKMKRKIGYIPYFLLNDITFVIIWKNICSNKKPNYPINKLAP